MSRRVWITGASEGIGRACAEAFAAQGASLVLCARRPGPLAPLKERLLALGATEVTTFHLDVSNKDDLARFAARALIAVGGIDVLVNNVGGGGPGRCLTSSDSEMEADWAYAFQTNLMAPLRLTRFVQNELRAAKGVVINISSAGSRAPASFTPPSYAATKAGLNVLTHELAREFGSGGVRVVGLAPGPIWTESWDRDAETEATRSGKSLEQVRADTFAETGGATKLGRPGLPAEIAATVLFLAGPGASFISGTTLLVDGGYVHSVP